MVQMKAAALFFLALSFGALQTVAYTDCCCFYDCPRQGEAETDCCGDGDAPSCVHLAPSSDVDVQIPAAPAPGLSFVLFIVVPPALPPGPSRTVERGILPPPARGRPLYLLHSLLLI
jgi:hypothetical protein